MQTIIIILHVLECVYYNRDIQGCVHLITYTVTVPTLQDVHVELSTTATLAAI